MQGRDYRYSRDRGQDNLYRYGLYGLLVLIWGSTWLVIRISLDHYPPFFTLAIRFLVAGLAFLGAAVLLWSRG